MASVKTTSTEQKLGKGPADQPHTGTKAPKLMGTSTQMPLNSRTEHRVAAFGAKNGRHGEVLCNSTALPLSRTPQMPYMDKKISATVPQIAGGGRKRK